MGAKTYRANLDGARCSNEHHPKVPSTSGAIVKMDRESPYLGIEGVQRGRL